ncbi:hypothetical protein C4569_03380 [Candidatus Parcubacteria bacterium]|nr:MAG: hypothetical protein C4569_03380 [Candidatus Parcubacteria bacterium]
MNDEKENPISVDNIETVEDPELKERMGVVAKNIIDTFGFQPKKESFLVITDTGVIEAQPELVGSIEEELKGRIEKSGNRVNYRIRVLPESKRSAEDMGEYIGDELKHWRNSPILIITSMSRSHSKETGSAIREMYSRKELDEQLQASKIQGHLKGLDDQLNDEQWQKIVKEAKKRAVRLISITKGKNPHEILTKGAVEESVEKILERDEKVGELMKDVKIVQLTSPEGTDIRLNLIEEAKGMESEDFSKPGALGNYPIGEWACSPDWKGSSGNLVIDGPLGGEHMLDQVKKFGPLKLEIVEGEIVKINGQPANELTDNPLAESVKAYLNAGNNKNNHGYRLAELGIGTNTKACQGKEDKDWGSSETEKLYGTVHIAVGSNGSLGVPKNHPSFNSAKVHCDMVLLGKINVECERKDGSRFFLIKEGNPQGY